MKVYKLTLTEEQLKAIKDACELRFRIDLLQDFELAEILSTMDTDLDPSNPNHERIFDAYIDRRDHIRAIIKALFEIACPRWSCGHQRNKESLRCEDIWQTIRYRLFLDNKNKESLMNTVMSRPPMQVSDQPLPTITVEVKKGK